MKILFTTLREKSHLMAATPFIEGTLRRGHQVAVSAPPDVADRVASMGAEFIPVGHPGDEGLRPIWMRMKSVPRDDLTKIATGEIFAGACAKAAIPSLLETLETWRPDVVLHESYEFAGPLAAEKVGIPHLRVGISSPGYDVEIRTNAGSFVDAHRRALGLAPDPTGERMRDEAVVTLFPPSFEPKAETARVARFRVPRSEAPPLPAWWGAVDGPFVYVTLGTVVGGLDALRGVYRRTIDALSRLPVRALLTVGAALPLEELGEIPPNVRVERFVPQDDVLPHADAVLCHGGSGTVIGALAAGVPLVVAPMFADQPHNAARVAAIGAGLAIPSLESSTEELPPALERVIHEASFRSAARRLASEIAALPVVDEALAERSRERAAR